MTKKARARKQRPSRDERRRQAPPPEPASRMPHSLALLAGLLLAGLIVGAVAFWQSRGSDDAASEPVTPEDPGPVHVHGLGVNPSDQALFIATHTGLFRVGEGEQSAQRVGDRYQDTMGFTIVGPNRFLGSGHPDINEAREKNLPALLGLIESTDEGGSWQPISLSGEADFHVLRFACGRVYGYVASHDR